jgi:hypothetical protein
VTHNGDFDFFTVDGQSESVSVVRQWLANMLQHPEPNGTNSLHWISQERRFPQKLQHVAQPVHLFGSWERLRDTASPPSPPASQTPGSEPNRNPPDARGACWQYTAGTDSVVVAGLMDLLRTQGCWYLSVRFAAMCWVQKFTPLLESERLPDSDMHEVAMALENLFCEVVAEVLPEPVDKPQELQARFQHMRCLMTERGTVVASQNRALRNHLMICKANFFSSTGAGGGFGSVMGRSFHSSSRDLFNDMLDEPTSPGRSQNSMIGLNNAQLDFALLDATASAMARC